MMKKQEMFQVDAFASELFRGNPAAVCILDKWLPEKLMQAIAAENNLAETAFAVPASDEYEIRWFTPLTEVALCGHATLATAHIIFNTIGRDSHQIRFKSRERGMLTVGREGDWLTLDFPAETPEELEMPQTLKEAVGGNPISCFLGRTDYMLVYDKQKDIEELRPNFHQLSLVEARGVIATAPGTTEDFVSRFFAPQCGINEDPVTGSAHTLLSPYWAGRLGKNELTARQLSRREGFLKCEVNGSRVLISGKATTYLKGEIQLPVH